MKPPPSHRAPPGTTGSLGASPRLRAAWLALAGILSLSSPAAASEGPPWMLAGLVLGFTGQTEDTVKPFLGPSRGMELRGAGGVQLLLRRVRPNTVLFAEGTALPLWSSDLYAVRAGLVWGWSSESSYSEYEGAAGTVYRDGKTYEVHKFKVDHGRQVRSVTGLHLGAGYHHAPSGNSPVLELGGAHVGQMSLTIAGLVDPNRAHFGFRSDMLYSIGDRSFAAAFGLQIQTIFNFKEQPLPLVGLLVLGFGPGFGSS